MAAKHAPKSNKTVPLDASVIAQLEQYRARQVVQPSFSAVVRRALELGLPALELEAAEPPRAA